MGSYNGLPNLPGYEYTHSTANLCSEAMWCPIRKSLPCEVYCEELIQPYVFELL
jgi:hypothetical protein